MKKVFVISLGGSLIVPKSGIDNRFLLEFKSTIKRLSRKFKFVIVCGGGSVARTYITSLRSQHVNEYLQSLMGISITRTNARFMSYLFDSDPTEGIPHDMKHVKSLLHKNDIVFCGALRYAPHQTSDSTAVKLANFLSCPFINMTNTDGLYSSDPRADKNALFISSVSAKDLNAMANKSKFQPGQHFVIDQTAAKVVLDSQVESYIIGKNIKNLVKLINGEKFKGTKVTF
jgi:uridylate kinase